MTKQVDVCGNQDMPKSCKKTPQNHRTLEIYSTPMGENRLANRIFAKPNQTVMFMKKLLFILVLLTGFAGLSAQNEVTPNGIHTPPAYNVKAFGDFLLDMNLLIPPKVPSFSTNLLGPDATKDYSLLFQLPQQMLLSKTYVYNSYHPFGTTSHYLQSATFQLNDNVRLTTYGQYTPDGKRIPNPSALPWEKNNFMGGMELKFNKNFGIQIEVRQGRNPMYPH